MTTAYISVKLMNEKGEAIGGLNANSKTFSTGSRGFHGSEKITIAGKRYQTSLQMVEIGSKPKD